MSSGKRVESNPTPEMLRNACLKLLNEPYNGTEEQLLMLERAYMTEQDPNPRPDLEAAHHPDARDGVH